MENLYLKTFIHSHNSSSSAGKYTVVNAIFFKKRFYVHAEKALPIWKDFNILWLKQQFYIKYVYSN